MIKSLQDMRAEGVPAEYSTRTAWAEGLPWCVLWPLGGDAYQIYWTSTREECESLTPRAPSWAIWWVMVDEGGKWRDVLRGQGRKTWLPPSLARAETGE